MNPRRLMSTFVDGLARALGELHVRRFLLLSGVGVMTFQHAAEGVSRRGTFVGYRLRGHFYERLLAGCGENLEMNVGATIAERATRIGDRVWVGPSSYLDLVAVGDDVLIGPYACILSGGSHHRLDRLDVPIRDQGNNPLRATIIGTGAWIGAHAVVLCDVGDGAVVAAGAVVTKPVPPLAIVAGNPASIVRMRGEEGAPMQ